MAKLKDNVSQAISDFDAIKASIESRGVEVGDAPTSDYAAKIDAIPQGGGDDLVIKNASYLFYNGSRLPDLNDYKQRFTGLTDTSYMFAASGTDKQLNYRFGNLDISGIDTSKVTNMSCMFQNFYTVGKSDLSYIIGLEKLDTSSVTNMAGMFYGNCEVHELDVSGFDTSSVTSMSTMFYSCDRIHGIDVSNFNTENVTSMRSMFESCRYHLKELNLSGWDTSKVTDMSRMFYACRSLKNLDVSSFDTSKVTNMSDMFSYLNVEKLNLSNFNTNSVTSMSTMFNQSMGLREIIGFSATNKAGITIGFPKGSTSTPAALRRLTFRTDLEEDVYAIRSPIDIRYCGFTNAGLAEMFNSLTDVSGMTHSASNKKITITGNPCLLDTITLAEQTSFKRYYMGFNEALSEARARYRGYDTTNAPVAYKISNVEYQTTLGEMTEELFNQAGDQIRFLADTIVIPEEDKLTEETKEIATSKGWTLVL